MERLAVGQIQGPHGVKGFFKVRSFSGEQEHFFRLKRLYVRQGESFLPYELEKAQGRGGQLSLKLRGVDSAEQAGRLRGLELWVERADASPLAEGEYYLADLCRCRLYRGGEEIGRVAAVCEGASADLLEVELAEGRRFLMPFVEAFFGEVDVQRARIEVKEGFQVP